MHEVLHCQRVVDRSDIKDLPVDLVGDACATFTAPFYADRDPLEPYAPCVLPADDDLDSAGALVRSRTALSSLLRGTLTFEQPTVELLTSFVGSATWREEVRRRLNDVLANRTDGPEIDRVDVVGMVFPDGYGSVAATLQLPKGWECGFRAATMSAVGADGREVLAAELRSLLLAPVQRMMRRCGAEQAIALPYFNLTYSGRTDHPEPGRGALDDDLRALVYPDSPMPLTSCSPWRDQFFYAGYAYHVLATTRLRSDVEKLSLLLLILNVSYTRLARTASAAGAALRTDRHDADVAWLADLERRIRSEYQSLVTPTFSYDHHALVLRDAILRSWDTDRLQSQAENQLAMVRQSVELGLAGEQARRIRRVNLVVMVLTILSAIATAEATVSLYDRLFG